MPSSAAQIGTLGAGDIAAAYAGLTILNFYIERTSIFLIFFPHGATISIPNRNWNQLNLCISILWCTCLG